MGDKIAYCMPLQYETSFINQEPNDAMLIFTFLYDLC